MLHNSNRSTNNEINIPTSPCSSTKVLSVEHDSILIPIAVIETTDAHSATKLITAVNSTGLSSTGDIQFFPLQIQCTQQS